VDGSLTEETGQGCVGWRSVFCTLSITQIMFIVCCFCSLSSSAWEPPHPILDSVRIGGLALWLRSLASLMTRQDDVFGLEWLLYYIVLLIIMWRFIFAWDRCCGMDWTMGWIVIQLSCAFTVAYELMSLLCIFFVNCGS
jgi:hypothetical protein